MTDTPASKTNDLAMDVPTEDDTLSPDASASTVDAVSDNIDTASNQDADSVADANAAEDVSEPVADDAESDAADAAEPDFVPSALFAATHPIPLTPEASADGNWLAYLLEQGDGSVALWISPTDGGDPIQVDLPFEPLVERDPDTGRLIRGPQWSPDGSAIALAGYVEGEDRTGIWLVPSPVASSSVPVVVVSTTDDSADDGAAPASDAGAGADSTSDDVSAEAAPADAEAAATSESGDTVAASAAPVEDDADTATVVEPATDVSVAAIEEGASGEPVEAAAREAMTAPRLLTWGPGSERSPRWSPDGNLIAFVSQRDRRDSIALATTVGDEPTMAELLTWSQQDDREPVWSRDGRFLAFTRQRNEGVDHADILIYSPESGELTNLTEAKASAVRHSLDWVAGRNLVAYVTQDGDWLSISVINADNKAGWAVTRESGDKTQPRFHPTEARLVYVRSEGFATVCCERGLHASGAVALDPSEGVVHSPRWLKDKRVVYGFSAPQKPFGFLTQDNLANAERTPLQSPLVPDTSSITFRQPVPLEFAIGEDEQFSGMLYRTPGVESDVPGVVYLPDGQLAIRRGDFNLEEQALASSGLVVFTPLLHGATGFGKAIEGDLADLATSEIEVSDIAEAGYGFGEAEGVDANRLSLVGVGFGGALALLTAGARPGIYGSVVAIDPITDWSIELAECDPAWRTWVSSQYGMPLTHPDKYALRTPATFSTVIDVPVVLVSTVSAPVYRRAQTELFAAYLDASGVAYDLIEADDEPLTATLERVSQKLWAASEAEQVG